MFVPVYGIEDAHKLANENDGYCLSIKYEHYEAPLTWKCHFGHVWITSFHCIKSGQWCGQCYGNKRLTIEHAQEEAHKHNGECLDKLFINTRTKMNWKCEKNHLFQMTLGYVRRGFWCPMCADNWYCIDDCHRIAKNRGGVCLSKVYVDYSGTLKWRCKEKHEWETSMRVIMLGHWCPECGAGKSQRLLFDLTKHIFAPSKYTLFSGYRRFPWLKDKRNLEIDIFIKSKIDDFSLALEYDGKQHFEPVCFGGISLERAEKEFKETKRRDKLKNRRIKAHPEDIAYFVRFNYKELLTEEYVRAKLTKAGVILPEKVESNETQYSTCQIQITT